MREQRPDRGPIRRVFAGLTIAGAAALGWLTLGDPPPPTDPSAGPGSVASTPVNRPAVQPVIDGSDPAEDTGNAPPPAALQASCAVRSAADLPISRVHLLQASQLIDDAGGVRDAIERPVVDGHFSLPSVALSEHGPPLAWLVSAPDHAPTAVVLTGGACPDLVLTPEPPAGPTVRCSLVGDSPLPQGHDLRVPRVFQAEPMQWHWEGDSVVIDGLTETGQGAIHLPDGAALRFSWDGGGCDPIDTDAQAVISGVVHNSHVPGSDSVEVRACGAAARVEPDGAFEFVISLGACDVVAIRRDGKLRARSLAVPVDPEPGDIVDVELELPPTLIGGIDLPMEIDGGDIRVGLLPAHHPSGLRTGDVFLRFGEVNTSDLDPTRFVETLTGPVDSSIEVEVLRGGDTVVVTLPRVPLRP